MSFVNKLKNKILEIEKAAEDLVTGNTVDSIIQKKRYDICLKCEHFSSVTTNCKMCGCFMKLKTKIEKAKCPVNKW